MEGMWATPPQSFKSQIILYYTMLLNQKLNICQLSILHVLAAEVIIIVVHIFWVTKIEYLE